MLTAPSIDPAGDGWLRLNPIGQDKVGRALLTNSSQAITPTMPLYFEFEYVSWGGSGADGLVAFLYDASQDMSGAHSGGALGYCGGAGAYLAIGLDEYSNFSGPYAPGSGCGFSSLAQGAPYAQSVVIRGPQANSYPVVATNPYAPGIDFPNAGARPTPTKVQVSLQPASPGYNITVTLVRNGVSTVVHNNVAFPYAAPSNVRVGFASSTGTQTNIHEVRHQVLDVLTDVDVAQTLLTPATATPGSTVSYKVTFTNRSSFDIPSGNVKFEDLLPAEITNPTWTCTGAGCPGTSGSGNIQALNGATMAAGSSVEFNVTGRLANGVTNGQVVTNTAQVSFDANSLYAGPQKQASTSLTARVTAAPASASPIPVFDGAGLLLASTGLGALGCLFARRRATRRKG